MVGVTGKRNADAAGDMAPGGGTWKRMWRSSSSTAVLKYLRDMNTKSGLESAAVVHVIKFLWRLFLQSDERIVPENGRVCDKRVAA